MKYIFYNLIFLSILVFTMNKSNKFFSTEEPQSEPIEIIDVEEEKDWDRTILEVERNSNIYNSW